MSLQAPQIRSIYRRFLRELPQRTPSILANPSPIQQHIRADLSTQPEHQQSSSAHAQSKPAHHRLAEAEQFIQYLQAQRLYTALLERYNPGLNMNEEDRIRLTAKRVGMELPADVDITKE